MEHAAAHPLLVLGVTSIVHTADWAVTLLGETTAEVFPFPPPQRVTNSLNFGNSIPPICIVNFAISTIYVVFVNSSKNTLPFPE